MVETSEASRRACPSPMSHVDPFISCISTSSHIYPIENTEPSLDRHAVVSTPRNRRLEHQNFIAAFCKAKRLCWIISSSRASTYLISSSCLIQEFISATSNCLEKSDTIDACVSQFRKFHVVTKCGLKRLILIFAIPLCLPMCKPPAAVLNIPTAIHCLHKPSKPISPYTCVTLPNSMKPAGPRTPKSGKYSTRV